MKLTQEQKDKIDNIVLKYAQGAFLSPGDEDLSPEEVMEELYEGNEDGKVAIWEPLEWYDTERVARIIEDHEYCLKKYMLKEVLEVIFPEEEFDL